jgi:hypothetical protein
MEMEMEMEMEMGRERGGRDRESETDRGRQQRMSQFQISNHGVSDNAWWLPHNCMISTQDSSIYNIYGIKIKNTHA